MNRSFFTKGLSHSALVTFYNYLCSYVDGQLRNITTHAKKNLPAAAAHEDPRYRCEGYKGKGKRCPYIGQKLLDTIQMGEDEQKKCNVM